MKISLPTRSLTYLLGIFLLAGEAVAGDQPATPAELVRRLGSDVFQEREDATQSLEKMGAEAREALAEGLNSSDPEIVRRCRILMPMIESQEMEVLLKKLSASGADPEELKLPGWTRFKDKVGSDASAKKFYLEICRAEYALIRDIERKPELGYDLLQSRVGSNRFAPPVFQRQVNTSVPQISESEIGAILFCSVNPKVKFPTNSQHLINTLLTMSPAMQRAETGSPLRRLVGIWLAMPDDVQGMINNLYAAKRINFPEAIDLASRLLEETATKKLTASSYQKGMAICSLNWLGKRSHVKLLLPFFADDAVITVNNVAIGGANQERVSTQVNDVALALAVKLSGQDPKTYGFANGAAGRNLNLDSPFGLGFINQDKRDEAFAKWAKWVKETNFDPNAAAKPEGAGSKPASPTAPGQPTASTAKP